MGKRSVTSVLMQTTETVVQVGWIWGRSYKDSGQNIHLSMLEMVKGGIPTPRCGGNTVRLNGRGERCGWSGITC